MKIQTKYFGEIEYDEDEKILFPAGLFGFESEREFLLIPFEGGSLLCFQSVRTPDLAFVSMNPLSLKLDYEPVLQPAELQSLGVQDSQDLAYYVLCVVKKPVSESTVNLKCPIAVNPETRQARQVILETDAYEMRHPLAEFSGEEAPSC